MTKDPCMDDKVDCTHHSVMQECFTYQSVLAL